MWMPSLFIHHHSPLITHHSSMVNTNSSGIMEEMAVAEAVFKRFGDEQSTLLDKYERLSFEVQLKRAILSRTMSETRSQFQCQCQSHSQPQAGWEQSQRSTRALGLQKAVKKLLSPLIIMGRKGRRGTKDHHHHHHQPNANTNTNDVPPPAPKDSSMFWKSFSRSLRVSSS